MALDPATLALTGWWRDYPSSGNPRWPGTASAGVSGGGSRDFHSTALPANGTALNGHATADLNGSTHFLDAEATIDGYINATSLSGWILINPDTTDGVLISTSGSSPSFRIELSGGAAWLTLNDFDAEAEAGTVATGAYALITFRYDGTDLEVGVNEAPGAQGGLSTTAYSTSISPLDLDTFFGADAVGSTRFDGKVAEIGITDQLLTDTQFGELITYCNVRYGLSLPNGHQEIVADVSPGSMTLSGASIQAGHGRTASVSPGLMTLSGADITAVHTLASSGGGGSRRLGLGIGIGL